MYESYKTPEEARSATKCFFDLGVNSFNFLPSHGNIEKIGFDFYREVSDTVKKYARARRCALEMHAESMEGFPERLTTHLRGLCASLIKEARSKGDAGQDNYINVIREMGKCLKVMRREEDEEARK